MRPSDWRGKIFMKDSLARLFNWEGKSCKDVLKTVIGLKKKRMQSCSWYVAKKYFSYIVEIKLYFFSCTAIKF